MTLLCIFITLTLLDLIEFVKKDFDLRWLVAVVVLLLVPKESGPAGPGSVGVLL